MIRLKCHWSNPKGTLHFQPGNVVGIRDAQAIALVEAGKAEYVPDGTRALRYDANTEVQTSCFSAADEVQEKGALLSFSKTEQKTNTNTPPGKNK